MSPYPPDVIEQDVGVIALRNALQDVLPTTLVSSTEEAEEVVSASATRVSNISATLLPVLAAALGSSAVGPLAYALAGWLGKRQYLVRSLPRWLKPALTAEARPEIATLTEFSNSRSRYVRRAVDEKIPVLLTRHGRVVAAVIALEEGAFEDALYPSAAQEIHSERIGIRGREIATLETLTDSEVEQIRQSENPILTAAELGVDLPDEATFKEWLRDRD